MDRPLPENPRFVEDCRENFAKQSVMKLIRASLTRIVPGEVEITLPFGKDLVQQDGYLHAGVVATVMDSAGGYAAYTVLPAGSSVLTSEFKIHFLEPAVGERVRAVGRLIRSGKRLSVCQVEAFVDRAGREIRCAWGSQTISNRRPGP